MTVTSSTSLPLAISIGEPAGIGADVVLSAFRDRKTLELPPFFVLADQEHLRARAATLGIDVEIVETDPDQANSIFQNRLPVVPLANSMQASPGEECDSDAAAVIEAITRAVDAVYAGTASAIVTAPINKKSLYEAGFEFPGHTEFLAELAKHHSERSYRPVMMLAGPDLRAVPVTIHIPLSQVPGALTKALIVETAEIVDRDLKSRFGIAAPRLAISGLNPHAGEGGSLGKEDDAIIAPAILELNARGINAFGPLPADTMFHARARAEYDAALCMYHDQALIPAKALAFDESVNVTLGLPFVRTSPDHGTAYDIAGSGKANPSSMIEAIRLAATMAATA